VIAWNTLEVLAYKTGNPDFPVNAIPPSAKATMHMRFVVGTDTSRPAAGGADHLAAHGFGDVEVGEAVVMHATRLDPDNAWVRFTLASLERSTGQPRCCCPTWAGHCPTTCSPTSWACPRCGSRTATPPASSTRPTSTCWPRWRARRCRSWPACSGTWATPQRPCRGGPLKVALEVMRRRLSP
jgi:hypothetical protein